MFLWPPEMRGCGSESWALKSAKYANLKVSHHFAPFAVETSGVLGQAVLNLFWDIGQRLRQAMEGMQQRVPSPKNRHHSTEGECCSSAWDCREAGGSFLGSLRRHPPPFTIVLLLVLYLLWYFLRKPIHQ